MKHFLFAFLFLAQMARAAELDATWLNGSTIRVYNNMACNADVRIDYTAGGMPKDTVLTVIFAGYRDVTLPGIAQGQTVRLKADGACKTSGWLTVSLSTTLAVSPSLTVTKTSSSVGFVLSEKGKVEKSADGRSFYSIGTFEKKAVDEFPEERNYYRLNVDGRLSPVVFVSFAKLNYRVYNTVGQLITITNNLNPYRWKHQFVISK